MSCVQPVFTMQDMYQAVGGFSLGEMTALIFANTISFEDGKSLLLNA